MIKVFRYKLNLLKRVYNYVRDDFQIIMMKQKQLLQKILKDKSLNIKTLLKIKKNDRYQKTLLQIRDWNDS